MNVAQIVMTRFTLEITEYDPSGYYIPKYKTVHKVITTSLEKAKAEALKRNPSKSGLSSWNMKVTVVESEDVLVET